MHEAEFHRHVTLEDSHWWFVVRRAILMDQLERFGVIGGLVEIGCGTGGNLRAFQNRFSPCVGVEIDPVAVELARAAGSGEVVQGDFRTALEGRWADFRWVLLADVLEHVENDDAFVADLWERMRPGARVLVTVPGADLPYSAHDHALGHWRRYRPEQLRRPFLGCGARVLFESAFNMLLYPPIRMIRSAMSGTASNLQPQGRLMNAVLRTVFGLERPLLRRGVKLPVGVSRLLVVEKP